MDISTLTRTLTLDSLSLFVFWQPPTTLTALFDRDGDGGVDRREFFYLVEYIVVQNALAMAQPQTKVLV